MFVMAGKCVLRIEDIRNIIYREHEQHYDLNFCDISLAPMFLSVEDGERLIQILWQSRQLAG